MELHQTQHMRDKQLKPYTMPVIPCERFYYVIRLVMHYIINK
jgi:hypothetical protein